MDGRNPAPPEKPWNDSIPQQIPIKNGFNHGFKVVRTDFFVHPQYFNAIVQHTRIFSRTSGLASCGTRIGFILGSALVFADVSKNPTK